MPFAAACGPDRKGFQMPQVLRRNWLRSSAGEQDLNTWEFYRRRRSLSPGMIASALEPMARSAILLSSGSSFTTFSFIVGSTFVSFRLGCTGIFVYLFSRATVWEAAVAGKIATVLQGRSMVFGIVEPSPPLISSLSISCSGQSLSTAHGGFAAYAARIIRMS